MYVEKTLSFPPEIPYLAIFRLQLEKAIVMLDFTIQFVRM